MLLRRASLSALRTGARGVGGGASTLPRRASDGGAALRATAGRLAGEGAWQQWQAGARRSLHDMPAAGGGGSLPWQQADARNRDTVLTHMLSQQGPYPAAGVGGEEEGLAVNGGGGRDEVPREVLDALPKLACTSHYIARGVDMHRVYNRFYRLHANRVFNNYLIVMGPFPQYAAADGDAPAGAATAAATGAAADATATRKAGAALPVDPALDTGANGNAFLASTAAGSPTSFIVLFKYGSVVFFNMSLEEQECHLAQIRQVCDPAPLPAKDARSEDLTLKVYPSLEDASRMCEGYTVVRALDLKNVMVISSVMAQTVALDYYAATVDEMVATFRELNAGLEDEGIFKKTDKHRLFKLVGQQNTVFMDLISRLALLEKSDVAWKHAAYYKVWEGLRSEYELKDRFSHLEWKLNLIQRNTKFFLEILHNQKSDNLEWTIIVLIAFEIVVSLADMANMDPVGTVLSWFP